MDDRVGTGRASVAAPACGAGGSAGRRQRSDPWQPTDQCQPIDLCQPIERGGDRVAPADLVTGGSLVERAIDDILRAFVQAAGAPAPRPATAAGDVGAEERHRPPEIGRQARVGGAHQQAPTHASSGVAGSSGVAAMPGVSPVLDELEPGPDLVALLDSTPSVPLATEDLVEGIAAWERVIAWAAARQAAMVGALAGQEASSTHLKHSSDEIATRLSITRAAAELKIALADTLDAYPQVRAAMLDGRIDVGKARIMNEELVHLPRDAQSAVVDAIVDKAPALTGPQLRSRIRKAVLATDPTTAERRSDRARQDRCVTLTPAPDTMAWFAAYLPADAALACFTAVDAVASMAAPGDVRPIDARRADALADILRGVLDSGQGPDGPLPVQQRRRPHIQVTVAAGTLLGLDDQPAELAGYGPVPASMARAVAQDGTWRRLVLDGGGTVSERGDATYRPGADLTGTVVARDGTCTFPGCRIPAWRCDIDHVVPFDAERPAAEQTTRANLHTLCRHHHRLKTETAWTVTRDEQTGRTLWTSPVGYQHEREPHELPGPPRTGRASPPDPVSRDELLRQGPAWTSCHREPRSTAPLRGPRRDDAGPEPGGPPPY